MIDGMSGTCPGLPGTTLEMKATVDGITAS
jgi:hypothetical protein